MAIQIQGNGGVVGEVDGSTFRALRITPRPVDYGAFGIYSYGGSSGILPAALGGNSEIFQFRWVDDMGSSLLRDTRITIRRRHRKDGTPTSLTQT